MASQINSPEGTESKKEPKKDAVSKRESKGRTVAEVVELKPDERVREIGRMLSGEHLSPEALRHAEKLIEQLLS